MEYLSVLTSDPGPDPAFGWSSLVESEKVDWKVVAVEKVATIRMFKAVIPKVFYLDY